MESNHSFSCIRASTNKQENYYRVEQYTNRPLVLVLAFLPNTLRDFFLYTHMISFMSLSGHYFKFFNN